MFNLVELVVDLIGEDPEFAWQGAPPSLASAFVYREGSQSVPGA